MAVTITTPDAVPGEVIEAAWGDAVRADLNALNAGKVNTAGDTMTGALTMAASNHVVDTIDPAAPSHLSRKAYVDARDALAVPLAGGTMTGSLFVGGSPDSTAPTPGIALFASNGTIANCPPASAAANQPNMVQGRGGSPAANTGAIYTRFDRGGTQIGSITVASATSVAYNTTSDPRSKTAPPLTRGIDDAAARVQAIGRNAWQGHHIDPDTGATDTGDVWDFVSSHDIEDNAPYAVYGERGAVDAESGDPVFQQVSYGDLVPLLFAALADALDRIDALEAAA